MTFYRYPLRVPTFNRALGVLRRFPVHVRLLAELCAHARTPWYAKAGIVAVIAYSLSPLDIVFDFIPILGHIDDAAIIGFGIAGCIRLIPPAVLAECRVRAQSPGKSLSAMWHLLLWVTIAVFAIGTFV